MSPDELKAHHDKLVADLREIGQALEGLSGAMWTEPGARSWCQQVDEIIGDVKRVYDEVKKKV